MSRIRIVMLAALAVFAISAVASASASAGCYKVAEPGTGNWNNNKCTVGDATNEYIRATLVTDLGSGVWCAKVEEPGTGNWNNNTCTVRGGTKEYIRVLENEEEQQLICRKVGNPCEEAAKKGFTSKSNEGIFEAGTNKIICKKDEDSGKLVGLESFEKVTVTFKECKGEETKTKATCTVKSTTATGAEEIVTNELRGEVGEVAESEAASKVGLLLEPVKEPFVTLVGSCLSPKESAVEGALIGEITPINVLQETSEVKFLAPVSGTQKIKTIERSLAKHCVGGRECKEDGVVKATLKAFGATAVSEETTDTNKFEEKLEVRPGL